MIRRGLLFWRRRYWRADPAKLAVFDGLTPVKVVTGGSEGLGLALAGEFVRRGDAVLLVARDPLRLTAARAALVESGGGSTTATVATLALDVTRVDAPAAIEARLRELGGYCDVLVNSAGIGAAGSFATNAPDRLDGLTTLNVVALTRLSRYFLPDMLVRGGGGILNVSSLGGYAPGPHQAAYYASKSYVTALTEALAYECAGQGVRIAVLAPGPVRTAFHARMEGETGLYLRLLPVPTADAVARVAMLRFRMGQRVIIPGVINPILMLSLRALPHRVTNVIVAALLKPRR